MTRLAFRHVLGPDGLLEDRALVVDGDGLIERIEPASGPWDGYLALPGLPNAHSHVFQRALSGFGEARRGEEDSFWTWREAMYRLAGSLGADGLRAVARFAYGEMLAAGFTGVAEFHYLHHGARGETPLEMATAVIEAAREAGIRLTLLPVLYERGGFGKPLGEEQRRFSTGGLQGYLRLLAELEARRRGTSPGEAFGLGVAPHSLRAVDPVTLPALLEGAGEALGSGFPVHIHVSEQRREVRDCRAAHGLAPVDLLARHAPLDARWNLVHATHATPDERTRIREADAAVVLCPITEAWLGDGLFPADEHARRGGRLAVGSDGNVRIDAAEELRTLEFGQRLRSERRARLATGEGLGAPLWALLAAGGAGALGRPVGQLSPGRFADLVVLPEDGAPWLGQDPVRMLDALVVGGSRTDLGDVYVGGRRVAGGGRPPGGAEARAAFRRVVERLGDELG